MEVCDAREQDCSLCHSRRQSRRDQCALPGSTFGSVYRPPMPPKPAVLMYGLTHARVTGMSIGLWESSDAGRAALNAHSSVFVPISKCIW